MADDKLKARIRALRAKTVGNGCTEDEALAAAAKVAELLDRHDLSLSDVELRRSTCERAVFATDRKKRMPIADCVGAVAHFFDCRVWREKDEAGAIRFVFFGRPADAEAALYLTSLVEAAVRAELGRYKTGADYRRFRHQDRHLANASFALGMVASIASKLDAMKTARARAGARDLVPLKASLVEEELRALGIRLTTAASAGRMVAPDAYEAGESAGAGFAITPGLARSAGADRG